MPTWRCAVAVGRMHRDRVSGYRTIGIGQRGQFRIDLRQRPVIVNVLPPFDGATVPPPPVAEMFAANAPFVSASTAVNVSPDVVGDSEMLTQAIGLVRPTPTVAVPGAVIARLTGAGVTVTAIDSAESRRCRNYPGR